MEWRWTLRAMYLTGSGVAVYSPAGTKMETIKVPEQTSNVCFGGSDRQTLFITAGTSLYAIHRRVKGW